MNFGITFIGHHACIKLNIKLSTHDREFMQLSYPDLMIYRHETKHGFITRIEGCMLSKEWHAFKAELDKAKLRSTIHTLTVQLDYLELADCDVDFDDEGNPCYISNTPPPRPMAGPIDDLPF